jgi:glyoxylase-like metal-dependent hydrolase (beta-lactamase superfamily II)
MEPEVLEVGPDVHFVEASHTNFVLIGEGDELTLVDSGYPKDRELVEASVRQIGKTLGDVSAVLLTHAHADHIGSAEWLRDRFGAPVHCHADEAAHARGEVDEVISERDVLLHLWRPGVLKWTVNAVAKGGSRPQRVTQVTTFPDEGEVEVPGRPVAIPTPGHTSGHAGFHLSDRGVLISGDALITVDVWGRSRRGPQVIRAPFNHDHAQAIESLARYEPLEAEVVVPGHGRPFRGSPTQAVDEARRRLR